jgi:hypothetical protein
LRLSTHPVQQDWRLAHHVTTAGGVVRYGVDQADPPVGDAAVDDLYGGHNVCGRRHHVTDRDPRTSQRPAQDQRDLRLGARLHERSDRHRRVRHILHVRQQVTEVRLRDPELLSHGLRRQANLVPGDHRTLGEPAADLDLLDRVRVIQRQPVIGLGQGRHGCPALVRLHQQGSKRIQVSHARSSHHPGSQGSAMTEPYSLPLIR